MGNVGIIKPEVLGTTIHPTIHPLSTLPSLYITVSPLNPKLSMWLSWSVSLMLEQYLNPTMLFDIGNGGLHLARLMQRRVYGSEKEDRGPWVLLFFSHKYLCHLKTNATLWMISRMRLSKSLHFVGPFQTIITSPDLHYDEYLALPSHVAVLNSDCMNSFAPYKKAFNTCSYSIPIVYWHLSVLKDIQKMLYLQD